MNDSTPQFGLQVPDFHELAKLTDSSVELPTFGGRLDVRWEPGARVTSVGGLAYFAMFLKNTGLFDRLCEDFPINYTSNNACSKRDILGTAILAILLGKTRYAHINAIRFDEAAKELLDLDEIVSEDTVRRAFRRGDEKKLDSWLSKHEKEVFGSLLSYRYVLDIDNTVKPIYGHQEGAEIGYNPAKPGRPSHNYHSYFIGSTRISLGVDVLPGKQHAGSCGMPRLWALIDSLPQHLWPTLLRGDVGYGNDTIMREAESRGIRYLFKIKRSRRMQAMFKRLAERLEWSDCGCGWESYETELRLDGWARSRRTFFIRRPTEQKVEAVEQKPRGRKPKVPKKSTALVPTVPAVIRQAEFDFVKDMKGREWDYCILVTNEETLDATAISQLYRDRGDCENNFDEFKNQWGWAGFTTRKMKACRVMARLIAIVANWWNVFMRLADPTAHREAITSRPAYMGIMGRIVESARRRLIYLTSTHAEAAQIRQALDMVAAFFRWLKSNAEQLTSGQRWMLVLRYAFRNLLLPEQPTAALVPIR